MIPIDLIARAARDFAASIDAISTKVSSTTGFMREHLELVAKANLSAPDVRALVEQQERVLAAMDRLRDKLTADIASLRELVITTEAS